MKNHFWVIVFIIVIFGSFSECADTEQLRKAGSQSKIFGFDFDFTSSQMRESNPGWLGEKRKRFLCAMPSTQILGDCNHFMSQAQIMEVCMQLLMF